MPADPDLDSDRDPAIDAAPAGAADRPAPWPGTAVGRWRRWRRRLLWSALVLLLAVAQSALLWLTAAYESARAQDQTENIAIEAAADVRRDVLAALQDVQTLVWSEASLADWPQRARTVLQTRRGLLRLERRGPQMQVQEGVDSPFGAPVFTRLRRDELDFEAEAACSLARRDTTPVFSRSYFLPLLEGVGVEVAELCLPVRTGAGELGFVVATISLPQLLDAAASAAPARKHELSFVESDGGRLARAGSARGLGVYVAERVVELPSASLQLRADSAAGRPSLLPNLTLSLVLGLSIALFVVVLLLVRDVRRRARAEHALAESLALRKAMEDSLSTGLRARDLDGRISYVNPAFCTMVGFAVDELIGQAVPPYWPPEQAADYARRQGERLRLPPPIVPGDARSREGFETVFMRRDGERFPVMIYEAPLVDGQGRHTGWMSSVLDISGQRRAEELSRQHLERLQASARLATVGEMASLLSHELNQPLAAIASYASGSMNMLDDAADAPLSSETRGLLQQALARVAEQAERAGRVIKSVHDFVRRREQHHEVVSAELLLDSVLPLVRLQARKSGTRVDVQLPQPVPTVRCDRTMVEQVLLNLARNGIQAMETATAPELRVLTIRVLAGPPRWVAFNVIDAGAGINPEVAARLFTPFFSTRSEGMGLGLSLCRTVIEQHGGVLDFESPLVPEAAAVGGAADGITGGITGGITAGLAGTAAVGGSRFRFTLPAASASTPTVSPARDP